MTHAMIESDVAELLDQEEQAQIDDLQAAAQRGVNVGPVLFPQLVQRSGLYQLKQRGQVLPLFSEVVRFDVDGRYPQMVISGTIRKLLLQGTTVHWIAELTKARGKYAGDIFFKDGNAASFPYTHVEVTTGGGLYGEKTVTVTYTGGGANPKTTVHHWVSASYDKVDFEFDTATGQAATTQIQSCAHPNHPANLACETLTVKKVYQRAGFDVSITAGGVVPLAEAGADAQWSDAEMHDAMQTYWSHFANKPQWKLWVLTAALHAPDPSIGLTNPVDLGGIMFDDIGPNHRQGTSIFNDSFIKKAPANDANPAAWVERSKFWTTVHEMGHAFNLAHSWQKSLGVGWIPLANEPEARSFMNYPYKVQGSQSAFFADFEHRFSDGELLFMRHAPRRFVQQGNADWFDDHGFENANVAPFAPLKLEARVNRDPAIFEYMEPAIIELKLTNVSIQPLVIEEHLLEAADHLTVIVKRDGSPAREYVPYATYCRTGTARVLQPGESVYEPLAISAGRTGWTTADPGSYTVQVALHVDDRDVITEPLRFRVAPPRGYEEAALAQDVFSDEVGRVLVFNGSRCLTGATDTLREVAERLPERRIALHANLALGSALINRFKHLDPVRTRGGGGDELKIKVMAAKPDEAKAFLAAALVEKPRESVESFGHVASKRLVDGMSAWLAERGDPKAAAAAEETLLKTMTAREVRGQKVLPSVLDEIKQRRDIYKAHNGRSGSR